MQIMNTTAHSALIDNVRKAGGKYTQGVQVAAVQAIGHMLKCGDTGFASRLLQTFTEGTVGKRQLVAYMEKFGGLEYKTRKVGKESESYFVIRKEAREKLPALGDIPAIESYMEEINATLWSTVAKDKVVSVYDVEAKVQELIKKATKEIEAANEVKHAELIKFLNLAVAQYHAKQFDAA